MFKPTFVLLVLVFIRYSLHRLLVRADSVNQNETITSQFINRYLLRNDDDGGGDDDDDDDDAAVRNNKAAKHRRMNVLIITTDQMRYDAINFVQREMSAYQHALRVRTPHLNHLARRGVYFRSAYCASSTCAPARASLRSGCVVERTGMQSNDLVSKNIYGKMQQFVQKFLALETYDQLLVEKEGYRAESYGKFHLPEIFFHGKIQRTRRVISYDSYDFRESNFTSKEYDQFITTYRPALKYFESKDHLKKHFRAGQQADEDTGFPYNPIYFDVGQGQPDLPGRGTLSTNYSMSHVLTDIGVQALNRLASRARSGQPFCLTISFPHPHPPQISSPEYTSRYWNKRHRLSIPKSIKDTMKDSQYQYDPQLKDGPIYDVPTSVREWTAVYYALVEEVDFNVGRILDALKQSGQAKNTLVVFTADHGEMLGAHGMRGKGVLLEEATRVPMLMSLPGVIPFGAVVDEPVSHVDVFATIMDYLNASKNDRSDGASLRRFIEATSFNRYYDEAFVVTELDQRIPTSSRTLSGSLGESPNFMARKGDYVLIITKLADSPNIDMLYNLKVDPYQINNLLSRKHLSEKVVGKAEHLKALLVEWMMRHDGSAHYYSNNIYNAGEGRGDLQEIKLRRTWPLRDYWQSDSILRFGRPVLVQGQYIRNEYVYIGRSTPGTLKVRSIAMDGPDKEYFRVSPESATIEEGSYVRIKVTYLWRENVSIGSLNAFINIQSDANSHKVKIGPS